MTGAELAQAALFWMAGNMAAWSPLACMALLGAALGIMRLCLELWADA